MTAPTEDPAAAAAAGSLFRCGHVAVVGRTNAGKSTLVNRLVGETISIVSPVPQTTRNLVVGIRNEPGAQIVLVDTPGFHVPEHELNRRMVFEARSTLEGVDAAVLVIDGNDRIGKGDAFVLHRVKDSGVPFIVALDKVDLVHPKQRLLPIMERLGEEGAQAIVPISGLDGSGLDALLFELRRLLPESPPVYPVDITTDQTERFLVAELIREQVLLATREEVPHSTAVLIERVEEKPRQEGLDVLVVEAVLAVEKENQKGILIGKGGAMLKRIGSLAREQVESLLGVRCHLTLHVAVHPRWRDDRRMVERMFSGTRAIMAASDPALLERRPAGTDGEAE